MKEKLALFGGKKAVTIPYVEGWKRITEEEKRIVLEMLEREEITGVPDVVREFEREFAEYVGTKYALSQCNGTSTLIAAYFAAGVGPGDEVIVPSYTWHASISPILHNNAIPVFCEVDPRTLTIDPEDVRRKITPRTKAICVVHMWGNVAKMDEIMEIAEEHKLIVIEDCSHAHGAEYDGRKVGSIGHIGCFSLQGGKAMVAGEGGIVVTNDTELYERLLVCGHYGRIEEDLVTDKYRHLAPPGIGYKFRAHPLAIGIAKVQLGRLDELNEKRAANVEYLDRELGKLRGIEPVSVYPKAKRGGFYGYRLIYYEEELGVSRERFVEALRAEGVEVSPCRYKLYHLHPLYRGYNFRGKGCPYNCPHVERYEPPGEGSLPVTEDVYRRLLALPVFTEPPEGLLGQYVEAFRKVVENADQLR